MNRPVSPQAVASILGRIPLLLLVAAVIAGIFGMHVVSGSHGTHSATSASLTEAAVAAPHVHGSSPKLPGISPAEADKCTSGSCSCAATANANCTPSLKTGSLAAQPPGTAVAIVSATWGHHEGPSLWRYRPEAPTPGQLSISRT